MRHSLMVSALGGVLLALVAANVAWSKAHVPVGRGQLCVHGKVIVVSNRVADLFIDRGRDTICALPACDFENVFTAASGCANLMDTDGDGRCEVPMTRDDAGGDTPACPPGTF